MPANVPFYLDYSKNANWSEQITLLAVLLRSRRQEDFIVRMPGVRMTAEIFDILRLKPIVGTFFTKEQNRPGADKVIVLTYSYWKTRSR